MKQKLTATLLLMLAILSCHAQIDLNKVVKRSTKKAERNVENRVEKRIDKGVDKSLDAVEDGIDDTVKGDGKEKKQDNDTKKSKDTEEKSGNENKNIKPQEEENHSVEEVQPEKQKPVLEWSKYDFVPGIEIIFEDNQASEQNGEFPSKWDLAGGVVENAVFDETGVIMFLKSNGNGLDGIVPLLKNYNEDYLPEEFTIEFDCYFEKPIHSYRIYLFDTKHQKNLDPGNTVSNRYYLRFYQNAADGKDMTKGYYPGFTGANESKCQPGWRHIALSFNKRALKAYIDDARVLNIPNLEINPVGLTLCFHNPSGTYKGFVKNIRIAKGAVPLYDKFLTDGKFITTGIRFDVNKSVIRPESMGTINYVVKMMQDHPELKFSVEGHTDSDGEETSNLRLSESRAGAVVEKMTALGISRDRLTSKGHGESKPLAGNDTPEGKAQNRRVEFVKF